MRRTVVLIGLWALVFFVGAGVAPSIPVPEWKDLFNGKDLTGWVNVNTDPDTWSVRDPGC